MAGPSAQPVNCRGCKHYRVSWDPRMPHLCAAMDFKSQRLPSLVVYESSGMECQMFAPKPPRRPSP
ncbi:MAG TPA: uracil-DNA glycosylase [Chloroflexota bacterium]|nr:uracil-DNA glycosylase [Chloroflexota bacterium]